jgi:O-antigen biosynthesis protein
VISVFTPSHDPRYLDGCLASLQAQTHEDWEWVVLLNHGAGWETTEPRAHVCHDDRALEGIGALKAATVARCTGDILVELDHDDLLVEQALERVAAAFDLRPEAGLVYSHCAQFPTPADYNPVFGWEYREVEVGGRHLRYAVTMPPTPANVGYIWFAPNHLRAFSRDAYDLAGGYDPTRAVLDDQDLMCRLYQVGPFVGIDEVLYLQRAHDANTQSDGQVNPFIQTETVNLYDAYIEPLSLAWARRSGLLALDLGSRGFKRPGYLGVDRRPGEGVDIVADLPAPLPLATSTVGVIRAVDFLEHVADKVALINELWRVLAPDGMLLSTTPSTDGRGAWQDPTHVAGYNEHSFWYYTDPAYQQYVPDVVARFAASRLFTGFPTEWHREHNIPYVTANLVALKPGS